MSLTVGVSPGQAEIFPCAVGTLGSGQEEHHSLQLTQNVLKADEKQRSVTFLEALGCNSSSANSTAQ